MLARIAHELYWLGRNIARAEHSARMLDGIFLAELQGRPDAPSGVMLSWGSLLAIMGSSGSNPGDSGSREQVLDTLALDPEQPTSVRACVTRSREGARTVRDVISAEMWEAINSFHLGFDERTALDAGPYGLASYVKARTALFWGVASRTMLRDEAHAFLEAGGRFESADMILRMLRVALPLGPEADYSPAGGPLRDGQALALLHAVGGVQAYRRAVALPPNALPVARFLLFTRSYPDSVAASVEAVRRSLTAADADPRGSEPVLRLSRLSADLEFRGGSGSAHGNLFEVCDIVGRELTATDRDISERYFGGAALGERLIATSR
jgi:uncharacterized alpha-E superfamily protein